MKREGKTYGHLPAKQSEEIPWYQLCVDIIGPYKITINSPKEKLKLKKETFQTLWCPTIINPATSWFEMRQIDNKLAITISNLVEQTWLCRYP